MNIGQLTNTIVAVANNELKNKIIAIVTQATQGRPDQQQLVALVTGAADQAIQQIAAGPASITVPVAAQAPPSTPGFLPGMQPGASPLGGLPGMMQMPGQQGFAAGPPAAGKMPANTFATLRECGPVVRVSSQQYPAAPPQGAKCGVEYKQKDVNNGNSIFCGKDAAAINTFTGTWCCKTHSTRKTVDLGSKGAKKSGPTSGSAGVSPGAHLRGIGSPNAIPGVFGTAPQTQMGLSAILGQNPFQNQNPFGGQGLAPPSTFNQAQGVSLMNSVPSAASGIPSQQAPAFNPINFNGMMNVPTPNAISIGTPFNSNGAQVTLNDDDDSDGEGSEEASEEHGEKIQMPSNEDLTKALAAASGMNFAMPGLNTTPTANPGLLAAMQGQLAQASQLPVPQPTPLPVPQGLPTPQTFMPQMSGLPTPQNTPVATPQSAPNTNAFLMQALNQAQVPQTTNPLPVPQSPAPITLESALAAATAQTK